MSIAHNSKRKTLYVAEKVLADHISEPLIGKLAVVPVVALERYSAALVQCSQTDQVLHSRIEETSFVL